MPITHFFYNYLNNSNSMNHYNEIHQKYLIMYLKRALFSNINIKVIFIFVNTFCYYNYTIIVIISHKEYFYHIHDSEIFIFFFLERIAL